MLFWRYFFWIISDDLERFMNGSDLRAESAGSALYITDFFHVRNTAHRE